MSYTEKRSHLLNGDAFYFEKLFNYHTMFLTYLLSISLIAIIAIMTQTESLTAEQTELIPVPVKDKEV